MSVAEYHPRPGRAASIQAASIQAASIQAASIQTASIQAASIQAASIQVVAADHPSLDRDVAAFLSQLAREPRFFGPTAAANPKPFPSLIRALGERDGFRLAAVERGRVIALVRIDPSGRAHLAVAAGRRGEGVGTLLGRAAVDRAIRLGYTRIVLRSSRRSRAARRVGEALGCVVVEHGRGRTDLIVDLHTSRRSA